MNRISYCGIDCQECKNYLQNAYCHGCIDEQALINDCPTRNCAKENGLHCCGECDSFPCKLLNDFYHDGRECTLKAFHAMHKWRKQMK